MTMPAAPIVLDSGEETWSTSSVLGLRGGGQNLHFNPVPGDGTTVEGYVDKLLADSFARSSTFWHYALRHVPSDSLMCADGNFSALREPPGTRASMVFEDNLNIHAPGMMDGLPPIPIRGYAAYPIGGVGSADDYCPCGWYHSTRQRWCSPPAEVCAVVMQIGNRSSENCSFPATSVGWFLEAALAAWRPGWACPETDFSDDWGVVTPFKAREWILRVPGSGTNITMRVGDLLASGRAGLRVGNAATLEATARLGGVDPSRRIQKLTDSAVRGQSAALRACAKTILSTFDHVRLVDDVIQDLFPAAQAVRESAPISSCLRYSIEYARIRMYESILAGGIRDTGNEIAAQVGSLPFCGASFLF